MMSFRGEFLRRIDFALKTIRSQKGWRSSEQALVGSDLEQTSERLRKQGYQVRQVPVGTWGDKPVAFILYKPKPGIPVKAEATLKRKSKPSRPETTADFSEMRDVFTKLFGLDDAQTDPRGWYMGEDHYTLLISADYPGAPHKDNAESWLKKFPTQMGKIARYPPTSFFKALEQAGIRAIHFGDPKSVYDIRPTRRIFKTLKGTPVTLYSKTGQSSPIIFKTDRGDTLILAPSIGQFLIHQTASYFDTWNQFKTTGRVTA